MKRYVLNVKTREQIVLDHEVTIVAESKDVALSKAMDRLRVNPSVYVGVPTVMSEELIPDQT